jgi:hypothetical protein
MFPVQPHGSPYRWQDNFRTIKIILLSSCFTKIKSMDILNLLNYLVKLLIA